MEVNRDREMNSLLKGYNMLLYFAGSMIMYEPTEECVVDFWSAGILKKLPVASRNPRFIEAASQLRNSCKDKTLCKQMLQHDFRRLFSDPEFALAVPVKSVWDNKSGTGSGQAGEVSEFYNSYGWKPRAGRNLADDHLGTEILFLTLLIDKFISFDDDACRNEMKNEIQKFIERHLFSWVPEWNNVVMEYADTTCYKGISTLILACTEDIYTMLDPDNDIFFRQNWLKN